LPKWYGGSALNPDELVQKQDQWKTQWYRVYRWFNRAQRLAKKSEKEELTDYDRDELIAFFQNCYHLTDWIKASKPYLKAKIEEFEKQNFEIKACRNICDGFKHKKLDNPRHPDPDFNWYRTYDPFLAEADSTRNPVSYHVAFAYDNDIKKYNVFDLVSQCFILWEKFIKENNL